MTDIPQELVDRVAAKMWAEQARNLTGVYKRRTPAIFHDQRADVMALWRGLASTAIAAMLDGVTLMWEPLHAEHCWRAPAPLFGSIRVEKWGQDGWVILWSVPGYCATFTDGRWTTATEAKAAALADYRARMLKAMTGQ